MKNERLYRPSPKFVATNLRKQYFLNDNDEVNLYQLIEKMNIKYRETYIGEGILGACKAKGLKRLIVVDPNIQYLPRKRFTIAHEIGHLLMHQGNHRCDSYMVNERRTRSGIESEANEFASELLMPQNVLRRFLKTQDISLRLIKDISEKYNTSLSSAAIALIKNSDDEVAILFHDDKKIDWEIKTEEMKYELEHAYLESHVTKQAMLTNSCVEGKVDADIWVCNSEEDIQCIEETEYFPKMRKFLTIVRIESIN